jgi:hypothetical protein
MNNITGSDGQRLLLAQRALECLREQARVDGVMAAWLLETGLGLGPDTAPFTYYRIDELALIPVGRA